MKRIVRDILFAESRIAGRYGEGVERDVSARCASRRKAALRRLPSAFLQVVAISRDRPGIYFVNALFSIRRT